jgi:hypothetical protein
MPISSGEGKLDFTSFINKHQPSRVLDVGAGKGTYGILARICKEFDSLDAVEVWKPYIEDYNLKDIYHNVYESDIRSWENFNYDLVVFGDILEHMTKEDAVSVWEKASKQAKYALISIPIIHYPQGHLLGNPYEEHVKDDWTSLEVLNTFPYIYKFEQYSTVGTFFAKFPGKGIG